MSRGRGRGSPATRGGRGGRGGKTGGGGREATRSTSRSKSTATNESSGSENEEEQQDGRESGMEEDVKPATTTNNKKSNKGKEKENNINSDNAGINAGNNAASTDLHALDDAVGMAGVDLVAEEEAIRASNNQRGANPGAQQQGQNNAQNRGKVRPRLILDEQALKDAVLRIAASFHLKNLESDSLPLIGLAVQMRIKTLIERMILAKTHRTTSTHLRPPPMYPARFEGDLPAPMWDTVLYDDVEKVLSTFDRVEKEEERQARKDRLARDQAEQEERERQERLARELGEDGVPGGGMPQASTSAGTPAGDISMMSTDPGTPGYASMPGTPMSGNFNVDLKGKGKEKDGVGDSKKRKRETPAQQAKNMSEDVRKRLSDQTAQRKLGGKKFSWLSGGGGGPSPPGGGFGDSPLGAGKKGRPKFPPLPPSSLSISTSLPSPLATPALDALTSTTIGGIPSTPLLSAGNPLARLSGTVPNIHEANRTTEDPANRMVTIRDALFVMEHERGKGAGMGSGTKPLMKAYMGRT